MTKPSTEQLSTQNELEKRASEAAYELFKGQGMSDARINWEYGYVAGAQSERASMEASAKAPGREEK